MPFLPEQVNTDPAAYPRSRGIASSPGWLLNTSVRYPI